MSLTGYIDNDNVFTADLYDDIGAADLSGGSAAITLTSAAGTQISGETWPLSLSYIGTTTTAPDGTTYSQTRYRYRVTLSDSLVVTNQQRVTGDLTFNGGPSKAGQWDLAIIYKQRTGTN